jgi:hypothetical protein
VNGLPAGIILLAALKSFHPAAAVTVITFSAYLIGLCMMKGYRRTPRQSSRIQARRQFEG